MILIYEGETSICQNGYPSQEELQEIISGLEIKCTVNPPIIR